MILLGLIACLPLVAQTQYEPAGEGRKECPRLEPKDARLEGGQLTPNRAVLVNEWSALRGVRYFSKNERREASGFGILDAQSNKRTVKEAKGKVVVVGFWWTRCTPSVKLLEEIALIQPNQDKFGVEIWPVSMDEKRWQTLTPFIRANKGFFKAGTRIFTPGLGSEGPNVFMEIIPSLPAVFILDSEGRVATEVFGYEPRAVEQALGRILAEEGRVPKG